MQDFEDYQNINKAIVELLTHKELFDIDVRKLQNQYLEGFQEILGVVMDHNFDLETFNKLHNKLQAMSNEKDILPAISEFVNNSIDNENAYHIINQYAVKSLILYIGLTNTEATEYIDVLLEKYSIDEQLLERVGEGWDKVSE